MTSPSAVGCGCGWEVLNSSKGWRIEKADYRKCAAHTGAGQCNHRRGDIRVKLIWIFVECPQECRNTCVVFGGAHDANILRRACIWLRGFRRHRKRGRWTKGRRAVASDRQEQWKEVSLREHALSYTDTSMATAFAWPMIASAYVSLFWRGRKAEFSSRLDYQSNACGVPRDGRWLSVHLSSLTQRRSFTFCSAMSLAASGHAGSHSIRQQQGSSCLLLTGACVRCQ